MCNLNKLDFFTITAEILAYSLANFYCQYADTATFDNVRRISLSITGQTHEKLTSICEMDTTANGSTNYTFILICGICFPESDDFLMV